MENQSNLPLSRITIRLRKALRLESTVWNTIETLDEVSEQSSSSPHYKVFNIYKAWLETFQIALHENTQHWIDVRHEKIRRIIQQLNSTKASKRPRLAHR